MYAICSIITAGTFGIVNLHPLNFTISLFSVVDCVKNLYFTVEQVKKLFDEFVQDNHITIDDTIVEDTWAKLNGCVALLNHSMRAQILS